MNFKKLKKVLSAGVAAVMCVTMALSVPAAAASTAYNNTKALSDAKYSSTTIKLLDKYKEKKATKTVSFSKSKTKKYYEAQAEKLDTKNPQYRMDLINKNSIVSIAMKSKKIKILMYMKDSSNELGLGMYIDKKNMTMLSPIKKMKVTVPLPDDTDYDALLEDSMASLDNDVYMYEDLGISDNAKGKYFKFTYDDKTYYYEEFETNKGTVGFLFNSKGNPIGITDGDNSYCLSYSYKVDDASVTVPKGYKEASEKDMTDDFFGNISL